MAHRVFPDGLLDLGEFPQALFFRDRVVSGSESIKVVSESETTNCSCNPRGNSEKEIRTDLPRVLSNARLDSAAPHSFGQINDRLPVSVTNKQGSISKSATFNACIESIKQ